MGFFGGEGELFVFCFILFCLVFLFISFVWYFLFISLSFVCFDFLFCFCLFEREKKNMKVGGEEDGEELGRSREEEYD